MALSLSALETNGDESVCPANIKTRAFSAKAYVSIVPTRWRNADRSLLIANRASRYMLPSMPPKPLAATESSSSKLSVLSIEHDAYNWQLGLTRIHLSRHEERKGRREKGRKFSLTEPLMLSPFIFCSSHSLSFALSHRSLSLSVTHIHTPTFTQRQALCLVDHFLSYTIIFPHSLESLGFVCGKNTFFRPESLCAAKSEEQICH